MFANLVVLRMRFGGFCRWEFGELLREVGDVLVVDGIILKKLFYMGNCSLDYVVRMSYVVDWASWNIERGYLCLTETSINSFFPNIASLHLFKETI